MDHPFIYVLTSITVFTGVILLLVLGLLIASRKLTPQGAVTIDINGGDQQIEAKPGTSLLGTLAAREIYLPSACGGGGTCAMCKCRVVEGGGEVLPTETGQLTRQERREGVRLSCQLKVKNDLRIEIPPEVLDIRKYTCRVRSNRDVATFIRELTLELPEDAEFDFEPGGYVQIDVPEYEIAFRDFGIDERFRDTWNQLGLLELEAKNDEPCFRAYSMANHPAEKGLIILNVRIALPPKGTSYPPGIASSYIYALQPGDEVTLSGPYGDFFIKDTDREMVYIGGGAGMAPLRSHIMHLLQTLRSGRTLSYWYGGRSMRELFYVDDFRALEKEFDNFTFHIALSEPLPEDEWDGPTGFIHQVVHDHYLGDHPDPDELEYYLCGPPMMLDASMNMLHELGVEDDRIAFDDFG
ncbi:NADH:ubiquinone reductase (Na(+)-transporting) subunit F [Kiritimatiella glycovorans]|uniref:Na(+)-translocating NADH-quinone reductase subunit F n=1 Tax=Kiritimatiella glycovorans TaxID=1307763 RepID=A0A0G3EC45_9BACT|nr:NADH:ubiquinone reductase (Na(+)-transporting) subunit F [Kiritimatiella glycovorans]AKJ63848.1 Na(+)-translocating NADH-quinone reductase subunit F [Kiritimatiella glycovorans]